MLEYILRREEQGKGNFDDITFFRVRLKQK